MDWQLILVKLIDGPGTGFTVIVLGLLGTFIAFAIIRATTRVKDAEREGRESRRASDLDLLKSQLARVVDDQKTITSRLPEPRRSRRRPSVIDAEVQE
jgi:phosphotransferase system  glucose/maltose/N-acetylglucosamine-specific IIC component